MPTSRRAVTDSGQVLSPGTTYTWTSLADRFGFRPGYLGAAGGMISRSKYNTLLIMTHPDGAKSFDYDDYWDGRDLIYAGRGKLGDQKLEGQNRDLAENRRAVLTFEPAGARQLRFLGHARCVDYWWTREPDKADNLRRVLRYRLRFGESAPPSATALGPPQRRAPRRQPRSFDPEAPPPAPPRPGQSGSTPEERAQLAEQATRGHHDLVKALALRLVEGGWNHIEEVPGGLDLWAT